VGMEGEGPVLADCLLIKNESGIRFGASEGTVMRCQILEGGIGISCSGAPPLSATV